MARNFTKISYSSDKDEIIRILSEYMKGSKFIKYSYTRDDRYIDYINGVVYCSCDGLGLDYKSVLYQAHYELSFIALDSVENHRYDPSFNAVMANVVVLLADKKYKTFELKIERYPIIQDTGTIKINCVSNLFNIRTKDDILSIKDIDLYPGKDVMMEHFDMLQSIYSERNLADLYNYVEKTGMWDYLPDYSVLLKYASEHCGFVQNNFFDYANIPEDFQFFFSDHYLSSYHMSYALLTAVDETNENSICKYYYSFPTDECRAAFINGLEEKRYILRDFTDMRRFDASQPLERAITENPDFFVEFCNSFSSNQCSSTLFDMFLYYVNEFKKADLEMCVSNIKYLKYFKLANSLQMPVSELSNTISGINNKNKDTMIRFMDRLISMHY